MTTLKEFMTEYNGHSNRYSSYMVVGKGITAQKVLDVLMKIDPDMAVGSGYECRTGKGYTTVSWEGCKESPDLIYDVTEALKCRGYADTDWNETYFVAAENGGDYDGYTACWEECNPEYREEDCWDAFMVVKDPSGAVFNTGAGAVDTAQMIYYETIVKEHKMCA